MALNATVELIRENVKIQYDYIPYVVDKCRYTINGKEYSGYSVCEAVHLGQYEGILYVIVWKYAPLMERLLRLIQHNLEVKHVVAFAPVVSGNTIEGITEYSSMPATDEIDLIADMIRQIRVDKKMSRTYQFHLISGIGRVKHGPRAHAGRMMATRTSAESAALAKNIYDYILYNHILGNFEPIVAIGAPGEESSADDSSEAGVPRTEPPSDVEKPADAAAADGV